MLRIPSYHDIYAADTNKLLWNNRTDVAVFNTTIEVRDLLITCDMDAPIIDDRKVTATINKVTVRASVSYSYRK